MTEEIKSEIKKVLIRLKNSTIQIQGIMKKASTSRPTEYMYKPIEYMENFDKEYRLLYSNIESYLEFLEHYNINLIHENPFKSLENFYDYYHGSSKFKTYDSRRNYISSLYDNMDENIDYLMNRTSKSYLKRSYKYCS
jgi:hypothetical protein